MNPNIPSKEVVIGETTYRVHAFIGSKYINLYSKVMNIVGPSISEFFKEDDEDAIVKAVKTLTMSLGDTEITPIIKEMLAQTFKDDKPLNIDYDFLGENFAHLPKLLIEIALFNWGSMFREVQI